MHQDGHEDLKGAKEAAAKGEGSRGDDRRQEIPRLEGSRFPPSATNHYELNIVDDGEESSYQDFDSVPTEVVDIASLESRREDERTDPMGHQPIGIAQPASRGAGGFHELAVDNVEASAGRPPPPLDDMHLEASSPPSLIEEVLAEEGGSRLLTSHLPFDAPTPLELPDLGFAEDADPSDLPEPAFIPPGSEGGLEGMVLKRAAHGAAFVERGQSPSAEEGDASVESGVGMTAGHGLQNLQRSVAQASAVPGAADEAEAVEELLAEQTVERALEEGSRDEEEICLLQRTVERSIGEVDVPLAEDYSEPESFPCGEDDRGRSEAGRRAPLLVNLGGQAAAGRGRDAGAGQGSAGVGQGSAGAGQGSADAGQDLESGSGPIIDEAGMARAATPARSSGTGDGKTEERQLCAEGEYAAEHKAEYETESTDPFGVPPLMDEVEEDEDVAVQTITMVAPATPPVPKPSSKSRRNPYRRPLRTSEIPAVQVQVARADNHEQELAYADNGSVRQFLSDNAPLAGLVGAIALILAVCVPLTYKSINKEASELMTARVKELARGSETDRGRGTSPGSATSSQVVSSEIQDEKSRHPGALALGRNGKPLGQLAAGMDSEGMRGDGYGGVTGVSAGMLLNGPGALEGVGASDGSAHSGGAGNAVADRADLGKESSGGPNRSVGDSSSAHSSGKRSGAASKRSASGSLEDRGVLPPVGKNAAVVRKPAGPERTGNAPAVADQSPAPTRQARVPVSMGRGKKTVQDRPSAVAAAPSISRPFKEVDAETSSGAPPGSKVQESAGEKRVIERRVSGRAEGGNEVEPPNTSTGGDVQPLGKTGILRLNARPSAAILVDGVRRGRSDRGLIELQLEEGIHTMTFLALRGEQRLEERVEVMAGNELTCVALFEMNEVECQ